MASSAPVPYENLRALIRRRLADEVGRLHKQAPGRVCLAYPSPYHVAMSSLGFQRIYRALMDHPGMSCERAFLGDEGAPAEAPVTYESLTSPADFPVIAVSVAYELELAGLVTFLEGCRLPSLREERDERHPLIIAGGPLTFSNPLPLAAFADVIVMGEAEELAPRVCEIALSCGRDEALKAIAQLDHVFVPSLHGDLMPTVAKLSGATLDPKTKIDGVDLAPVFASPESNPEVHDRFYFYDRNRLMAVRSGKWKLKVETSLLDDYGYKKLQQPDAVIPMGLFNLEWDPGEMKDVSKDHPDVVKRLEGLLAKERDELGDERTKVEGHERRPAGRVEGKKPLWDQGGAGKARL